MGNSGIIYDRKTVDFGASGITSGQLARSFDGERVFAGTTQTTLIQLYDAIEFEKTWASRSNADLDLYLALRSFWNGWAAAGKPFAVALDLAKLQNIRLDADIGTGNLLANGDMEVWAPGDTYPDGWTMGISGGTTITRETKEGEVSEGLYALKWTVAASAQSTAKLTTVRSLAAATPAEVAFSHKGGSALGKIQFALRDVTANVYLQLGGTWAGGIAWLEFTPTSQEYQTGTQAFTSNGAGLYEITFRNASTAASVWLDDVRIVPTTTTVALRSLAGFVAGDGVRFLSRAGLYEEVARITTATPGANGAGTITFTPALTRSYVAGDFVRHRDFYPFMVADQKESAISEVPGARYELKMKCREAMSGRV